VTALVDSHRVTLTFPAAVELVRLARLVASGLAAHAGLSMDDIEDLRIAVDEACAMVLPQARSGSDLTCGFLLAGGSLTVAVTAECDDPRQPSRDGFAWTVLSALTNDVSADVGEGRLTITLSRHTTEAE
jgi:serine/threonine-protein kinase RsbW